MRRNIFFAFAIVMFHSVSAHVQEAFLAKDLQLEWELVQNNVENKNQFLAALTLINKGNKSLDRSGWKLFFNLRYHGFNLQSQSEAFNIIHESGDLFYIQPTEKFNGLKPLESIRCEYTGNGIIANYQDVPSGFFWVDPSNQLVGTDIKPPTIKTLPPGQLTPHLDATKIFEQNKLPEIEAVAKVFPTPVQHSPVNARFSLDKNIVVATDRAFVSEAEYLVTELEKLIGSKLSITTGSRSGKRIELRKTDLPSEAYHLEVTNAAIIVEGGDGAGIFYGIQTLRSLLPPDVYKNKREVILIDGVQVDDKPRFPVREFMLDVARNFQTKDEVLKVLEVMSIYKLNYFHLHFNDDEGWRLDIPGLPELTEVGSRRGYPYQDNSQLHPAYGSGVDGSKSGQTGFYTRNDFIEILQYAAKRHITVVPEFEAPGHARAAVKAMESRYKKYMQAGNPQEAHRYLLTDFDDESTYMSNQYFRDNVMNVALPSTFAFIEKVIDEIGSMYKEAGVPFNLMHMAGDEVPHGSWEKSPVAKSFLANNSSLRSNKDLWRYYFDQIKLILQKRNLQLYGWQELVIGAQTEDHRHIVDTSYVRENVQLDAWWNLFGNEGVPYTLANAGYKVVLTCFDYFYFDLAYASSFQEPGDGWIGFLDIDKTFSFIPYEYYKNSRTGLRGNILPDNFYEEKEKLRMESRNNILGLQGALWGENLISSGVMEYLLLPRLLALAERSWSKDPSWSITSDSIAERKSFREDWARFAYVLGKRELPKLDDFNGGYNYRIPAPGASIVDGKVIANCQLPGFVIRYTINGDDPSATSPVYTKPFKGSGIVKLRAFNTKGRGSGTSLIVIK